MDINTKIEEAKRRTNLLTAIGIDWQYVQKIAPQVLNDSIKPSDEFKTLCVTFSKICTDIEENIKELKNIIPNI